MAPPPAARLWSMLAAAVGAAISGSHRTWLGNGSACPRNPVSVPGRHGETIFVVALPVDRGASDPIAILESDQRHALYCGAEVALREDVA